MNLPIQQLVVPVVVFTGIIVLLSLLVLAARNWLAPSGPVQIVVNGQRTLTAEAGGRLLWTLARHGIYLPAACGGRGTCGQCRVVVRQGIRPLLPTEASQIDHRDAALGARLACMFTVREDLAIEVDRDRLDARRWECTVRSNRFVAPFLKELTLKLPEGERLEFEAGDYVLLEAPPHDRVFDAGAIDPVFREEWHRVGLIGIRSTTHEPVVRAYSLANPPAQADIAQLIVRLAAPPADAPGTPPGKASSYIFGLGPDDLVTISGPFGDFHATEGETEMVLIAGGAGIAPIRSIILDQLNRGTRRPIRFWYGARDLHDLCYRDEFDALASRYPNFEWHAALSAPRNADQWQGATGLIHTVVYDAYLKSHVAPAEIEYFLCGPPLMSAAVVQLLDDIGVPEDRIFFDDFGSV